MTMPGIVQDRRKRPSENLSEDESLPSSPGSEGSKRARYGNDASQISVTTLSTGRNRPRMQQQQHDNLHDEDEYKQEPHKPGSIVRVKLRNFVTYTAAEFHPGPSLNMVIGPNGTGKSTLVCAICLGLGWETKNLGRAKEIGEFVKHGSAEATIEVELAASSDQRTNPVIRRVVRKEGNRSTFHINGRSVTQKEVVRLAKSFSIQIDNLCQFLPQDRVVEFAGLTPIALLAETQRAAAPEYMVQWHEDLKTLRNKEKSIEIDQSQEKDHLQRLQASQNATRDDVRHWHERQSLLKEASALERCRPLIQSNILKDQHAQVKAHREAAIRELRQLEAEVAPTRQAQEDAEKYQADIEKVRGIRSRAAMSANQHAEKIAADIKEQQSALKELEGNIEAERGDEKQRRLDARRIEKVISDLELQLSNPPDDANGETMKARRTELRAEASSAERRCMELRENMDALADRIRNKKMEQARKASERSKLDTQSGQQASRLQSISRDTAAGWEWIERNRESLQLHGEVHGPPVLTCSVADPALADAVEAQMKITDFTAITCTDGRDARLLSSKLLGEMKFHQVSIRTVPQALSSYRPPVTKSELEGYGFDGWMLDYIKGPDAVLAMLCDSAAFHRTAFSRAQLSSSNYSAVEQSPIASWIADGQKYRITRRREYGQSSTSVISLKKARIFTGQPIDTENKRQLDNMLKELDQDIRGMTEERGRVKIEMDRLQGERDEARAELDTLKADMDRAAKAKAFYDSLPIKIEQKKCELDTIRQVMSETSRRVLEYKAKIEEVALQTAGYAIEYAKAVARLRQMHENLVEAEIRFVEACSESQILKAENEHILQYVKDKEKEVNELKVCQQELKARYNAIISGIRERFQELTVEEKALLDDFRLRFQTEEELENQVEAVKSKLGMMSDGNANAVKAFEKREQEIETVQERLQSFQEELDQTKEQMKATRDQWEPQLDALVAKISDSFSHNFAQIGCAGHVEVHKDEDFENWSIQIQVRFRENEALSILDSQRQSGGERAVSTIFYLMALQDLARSPFRVVDEINQGMDPRNERMVHERMVDVACREHTSQYFLITPKLLTGLKFHPKMTVHCIASGDHMPDEGHEKLDFAKMAKIALRVKRGIHMPA
ncbi:P-loop containing nucleoside triphosphate hydrolase protein [Aaosphaeria arxii CBS 175.79]|uniref:Structural maintenance of chromosomes protein 5 n=1 Tax=Aaosphaeria arxii CBS 175.79 TaxID=1450172 RepID=A0A6A5XV03_9PLEO|nr:P-loop containing nucleoside triphosphate hydrolase protein [Aaosphaeria arxii CBS 175.79]KAF2017175.1 P-loop containing nucleoside triphosphate hydrolase protein [Aaosphaeria arxii CBS 175.79]